MGRSMYQYGNQTKEQDRQLKQMAKKLKRSAAKQQQANIEVSTLPEGAVTTERNQDE